MLRLIFNNLSCNVIKLPKCIGTINREHIYFTKYIFFKPYQIYL